MSTNLLRCSNVSGDVTSDTVALNDALKDGDCGANFDSATQREARMIAIGSDEARDVLMDELANGHDFIPFGHCDNFDFKSGCKGHPSINKEEDGHEENQ